MTSISSVAVFCGSRAGHDPAYATAARDLGFGLAKAGIRLIYGGGKNGMMGILADSVLAQGGDVLGVIPEFLTEWEVAHPGVSQMEVTTSMHSRKQLMAEQADAFVTMPGGLGTIDETIEILTWKQLRLHAKPIYICDIAGSATPECIEDRGRFLPAIEATIPQGCAGAEARSFFTVVSSIPALLAALTPVSDGSTPS